MKVNSIDNINFQKLRGLSEPNNAEAFKVLSQKYGKKFYDNADRAFQTINDLSGDRDVFIHFRILKCDNEHTCNPERMTDIILLDENGKKVAEQQIDSSQGGNSHYAFADKFRKLVNAFSRNFRCNRTFQSAIDNTIKKFA